MGLYICAMDTRVKKWCCERVCVVILFQARPRNFKLSRVSRNNTLRLFPAGEATVHADSPGLFERFGGADFGTLYQQNHCTQQAGGLMVGLAKLFCYERAEYLRHRARKRDRDRVCLEKMCERSHPERENI